MPRFLFDVLQHVGFETPSSAERLRSPAALLWRDFCGSKRRDEVCGPVQRIVGRIKWIQVPCREQIAILFEVCEAAKQKKGLVDEDECLKDMHALLPAAAYELDATPMSLLEDRAAVSTIRNAVLSTSKGGL